MRIFLTNYNLLPAALNKSTYLQNKYSKPFTLPTVDGTTGQVMVTNGSGTVTWGPASSSGTVTSITVGAGSGLTGGGTITTSGTVAEWVLNIFEYPISGSGTDQGMDYIEP